MDNKNGVWKTLPNGIHIFIEDGQTLSEAINSSINSKVVTTDSSNISKKDIEKVITDIGFKIKYGTHINKCDKKLLLDNFKEFERLQNEYPLKNAKYENFMFSSSKTTKGGATASICSLNSVNFQLSYESFLSEKQYKEKLLHSINENDRMPTADKYLSTYTMRHEYGHILEYNILYNEIIKQYPEYIVDSKTYQDLSITWENKNKQLGSIKDPMQRKAHIDGMNKDVDILNSLQNKWLKIYQDKTDKIENEIYAINSNELKQIFGRSFILGTDVSNYGNTNSREFFAECFANLSDGKINIAGYALKIWLQQKGYI